MSTMHALIVLFVVSSSMSLSSSWLINGGNGAERLSCSLVGTQLYAFPGQRYYLTACYNHQHQGHDDPSNQAIPKDSLTNTISQPGEAIVSRRHALQQSTASILFAVSSMASSCTAALALEDDNSKDSDTRTSSTGGLVSADQAADLLRAIPTFTIVDKQGIPYMVVGEDAKVTCYFFTTFTEARRLLDLAKISADKAIVEARKEAAAEKKEVDEADLVNPWKSARISTVPLDFAATLVTKSLAADSQSVNRPRGRGLGGNFFQIAATEDDLKDALSLTGKDSLAEGKVPLFYMEDFTIDNNKGETKQTPLYFSKGQLEKDYARLYKASKTTASMPEIKVTELFAVLVEMVSSGTDPELQNLVFIAPPDSAKRAKECIQKGGKEFPPFVLGQRNVIL